MPDRRVQRLKLMPDYLCEMPLWLSDPLVGQVRSGSDLLRHAPSLLEQLGKWQAEFDANFDPFNGWLDDSVRASWTEESERLVAELRKQLPLGVVLDVDLWPIASEQDE